MQHGLGTTAGVSGFGKYTQESWAEARDASVESLKQLEEDFKNGVISEEEYNFYKQLRSDWTNSENLIKGIITGGAKGAWEGLQWWAGGKLNQIKYLKAFEGSALATAKFRIGIDTGTAGLDPIYKAFVDSMTDTAVNGTNFFSNMKEEFEKEGGWQAVATNAAIGGIASSLSEGIGAFVEKLGKTKVKKPPKESSEAEWFKPAGDLDGDGMLANGFEYAGDLDADIPTKIDTKIKNEKIQELVNAINKGKKSDPKVEDFIEKTFKKWLAEDNIYAEELIDQIIKLKKKYPKLSFEIDASGGACWSLREMKICMGENFIKWGDSGTYAHELGHFLFDLNLSGNLPKNWDDIVEKARHRASNETNTKLMKTLSDIYYECYTLDMERAYDAVNDEIRKSGYKSISDYISSTSKEIEKSIKGLGRTDAIELLKSEGFDDEIITALKDPSIKPKEVLIQYMNNKVETYRAKFNRTNNGGSNCAISDIIASVFDGKHFDLNGKLLNFSYSHTEDYYKKAKNNAFHEIIANFNQLKVTKNTEGLQTIKELFGDEFYEVLEMTYKELFK